VTKAAAPGREEPPIAAWSALVSVYQGVLHDVVQALNDHVGMDSGLFSALAYVERADPPHRIGLSDLQHLLHPRYSQPGLSRLVQRMEADGLVERRPDPADGRAAVLVSTRAGRRAYARANAVYSAAVHDHFGRHLSPNDDARLADALNRLASKRDSSQRATT
jgi:DNA-binding MarR family transcriptional regulator